LVNHIQNIINNPNTQTKKGGAIVLDKNTIKNYNTFKKLIIEYQETKTLSITPEKLNNAQNWILIGCAIGQRGEDLFNITHDNIRYNLNGFKYLALI
jgi:hypothetical protein